MKKLVLIIAGLLVVFHTASLPTVHGQAKQEPITAEEKKAAQELADKFIYRLDETGDIEPLMKEMFVKDFIERHLDDERKTWSRQGRSSGQVFFVEADAILLDGAYTQDWRQYYIGNFNFIQYGMGIMMNKVAKSMISGGVPKEDDVENAVEGLYPEKVIKFLENNPNLKDFYKKKGPPDPPIRTIQDLRDINKTLIAAVELLKKGPDFRKTKMSPDAKKVLLMLKDKTTKDDFYQPSLELSDNFRFGYPSETRIIRVNSAFRSFLIIKDMGEYRIINVDFISD